MTRRALLVGVQTCPAGTLRGPRHDVEAMKSILESPRFEFAVEVLPNESATRDGILMALDDLLSKAGDGDTRVFYFSGHGTRIVRPDADETQCEALCPHDFDVGADAIAIKDFELHERLRRATNEGAKVTAILDCCFAGGMPAIDVLRRLLRAGGDAVRAGLAAVSEEIVERLDLVGVRSIPPAGNPFDPLLEPITRGGRPERTSTFARARQPDDVNPPIVFGACRAQEVARERKFGKQYMGVFTHHLVRVLSELPTSSTNSSVRDAVRAATTDAKEQQLPIAHPTDPDAVFLE